MLDGGLLRAVSKSAVAQAVGMTLADKTVTLRLLKVALSTGQIEVLATSLIDA